MLRASQQPGHGVGSFAQPCGPSWLQCPWLGQSSGEELLPHLCTRTGSLAEMVRFVLESLFLMAL